jgi:hypothetical protein
MVSSSSLLPGTKALEFAALYRSTSSLANVATVTNLNLGPNFNIINNSNDEGGLFTTLPLKTVSLNVGEKLWIDTNGTLSTDGSINASSFYSYLADGTPSFVVDTLGNENIVGNFSVNLNPLDGSSSFFVDALSGNVKSKGDIFSNTSYHQYINSSSRDIVVNKKVLDQVVENITSGSPATIAALSNLIQSFNEEDNQVFSSMLKTQNTINNDLLTRIDILYNYFFNFLSNPESITTLYGTPASCSPVAYSNLVIANNIYTFDSSNQTPYQLPTVSVDGSISVSGIPIGAGTYERSKAIATGTNLENLDTDETINRSDVSEK